LAELVELLAGAFELALHGEQLRFVEQQVNGCWRQGLALTQGVERRVVIAGRPADDRPEPEQLRARVLDHLSERLGLSLARAALRLVDRFELAEHVERLVEQLVGLGHVAVEDVGLDQVIAQPHVGRHSAFGVGEGLERAFEVVEGLCLLALAVEEPAELIPIGGVVFRVVLVDVELADRLVEAALAPLELGQDHARAVDLVRGDRVLGDLGTRLERAA